MISPGGIGFDINCGMRLIRTDLTVSEVAPRIRELVNLMFEIVPAGVGSKGLVKLSVEEFKRVMACGVGWCIEKGYGWEEDRERIEENGCIQGADPSKISEKAISRGISQLGTLGSGNHYLEIQIVTPGKIFDKAAARAFGIFENQVVIMVHCGSRGFGHQVATDYLRIFDVAMKKYGITVRDRELPKFPTL